MQHQRRLAVTATTVNILVIPTYLGELGVISDRASFELVCLRLGGQCDPNPARAIRVAPSKATIVKLSISV